MPDGRDKPRFQQEAGRPRTGLGRELRDYVRLSGKWWLLPILIVLLGVGATILVSATSLAPFLYALL